MALDRQGFVLRDTSRLGLADFVEQVGKKVEWEQLHRPKAYRAEDVPYAPEAITAEWLTAVLCKNARGASVTDFTISAASSGTSERHNILVAYNEAGRSANLPEHIFSKSMPTLATRVINGFTGTMVPQTEFYLQIRPELDIEAPVAYHASYDTDSFRSILLFDDLVVKKGASFCNWKSRLDRKSAEELLGLLGAVAGQYYDDPRMDKQFSWLPRMVDWYLPIHVGLEFDTIFDIAIDEAGEAIPADFVRRRAEIWPALRRALQLHEAHPRTLLHNDSHLGNVYITAAGQAALCDWQCVCSGLWARDIAYAISTMLPIEDRRLWERDLVALYLDRMNQAAGKKIASFDEAWLLYRQQLVLILPSWLPTLHRHPDAPEMQPKELSLEMVRRVTTAMSDLGSFDV